MECSRVEKRILSDDSGGKILEPILIRVDKNGSAPRDIHIDKNEFKIGRGRDNDEIILDTMISRRHCILRCQGNGEWIIKDLSSTSTFINDIALISGVTHKISVGDIIQFSTCKEFKYVFTLNVKEERDVKRPRMDRQILNTVLTEQKTFSENQEFQRKELKHKLYTKQKEQIELKQQLEELLKHQSVAKNDKEDSEKQIAMLESKIKMGNSQEQHLHNMYAELLKKLEDERVQFEARLNVEKQKWQEALDISKQEKEIIELEMKNQMERWREQQQAEWRSIMENRVKEEKDIQAQLLTEKFMLEEKLKETERALLEKETKVEILPATSNDAGLDENSEESCIIVEVMNICETGDLQLIDTIDLTENTQISMENEVKDGVLNKVSDIMEEQLTCSVCSELFVKATTLNCTHTFCHYCINSWNKKRKECPICRTPVSSMNRSLVLDNFIESMLDNLPGHCKDRREEIIRERKA